jgi:8-oxo-dGTP pyrophosphatase MutT (NUDIX family)
MPPKYAGFFIIDINNKVLILKENSKLWGSPGGHIEDVDKNPKEAAIREMKEETGIDYHKLDILKEKSWTWKKTTKIYVIKVKKIPKVKLSHEHTSYKKIHVDKLFLRSGDSLYLTDKYVFRYSFISTLSKNLKLILF